jgi:serine/threonine protein kinase
LCFHRLPGSLNHPPPPRYLSSTDFKALATQLASAVHYLHSQRPSAIVHRESSGTKPSPLDAMP